MLCRVSWSLIPIISWGHFWSHCVPTLSSAACTLLLFSGLQGTGGFTLLCLLPLCFHACSDVLCLSNFLNLSYFSCCQHSIFACLFCFVVCWSLWWKCFATFSSLLLPCFILQLAFLLKAAAVSFLVPLFLGSFQELSCCTQSHLTMVLAFSHLLLSLFGVPCPCSCGPVLPLMLPLSYLPLSIAGSTWVLIRPISPLVHPAYLHLLLSKALPCCTTPSLMLCVAAPCLISFPSLTFGVVVISFVHFPFCANPTFWHRQCTSFCPCSYQSVGCEEGKCGQS